MELAALCRVHPRTLYDWRSDKYSLSASALDMFCQQLQLQAPAAQRVNCYRHVREAGRIGARARYALYGNPGTLEGRHRGGQRSQQLFCTDPTRARPNGFVIRKAIERPPYSAKLAEFVGIMLGDGYLGDYQVMLYFNSRTEQLFADYVQKAIRDLFGFSASRRQRECNCLDLVASGKNLVEYLRGLGLTAKHKLKEHADVPAWVFQQTEWMQACLRGLIDTDGTLFFHTHRVGGHRYRHIGLTFTSYAPSLLNGTHRLFHELGYASRLYAKRGNMFLFRRGDVTRYMETIGSQHPHRMRQFLSYQGSKDVGDR